MESFYYSAMLIGIAWLAVWSVLPDDRARTRWWWPFDMLDVVHDRSPAPDPAGTGHTLRRGRAAQADDANKTSTNARQSRHRAAPGQAPARHATR